MAVLEGADSIGGGTRTAELTLSGFHHDHCSGVHPMGALSPFFGELPLAKHGLDWIYPLASVAHPLDDQPAAMLWRSLDRTASQFCQFGQAGRFEADAESYRRLLAPLTHDAHGLLGDIMASPGLPKHPLTFARFAMRAAWPAAYLARTIFGGQPARALLAGCAAHSILPLSHPMTSAIALVFAVAGHTEEWPLARGGSVAIANALGSYLESLGGTVQTGVRVTSLADLPAARTYLFDTDPHQLARIADAVLPTTYKRRLRRYRFGPGAFKVDWALDGPIPWSDPTCLEASTVHVGGTLDEIAASEAAMWRGMHSARPFTLVLQQSQFDSSRAPDGKHTGYAYCHVPHGSNVDMTEAIEAQVERFAPGFRKRILARHSIGTREFERDNPNYVGGAITGGAADISQLFARPVARLDPYSTPNPRIFICSASTPPGGGVHGMCGHRAALSALRGLDRFERTPLAE